MSSEDVGKVLDKAVDHRLRPLWVVLLALGLRKGEALALHWEDLDLKAGTVRVHRSLQRLRDQAPDPVTGKRKGRLVQRQTTKTGAAAERPLPAVVVVVVNELEAHRRSQLKKRLAARHGLTPRWSSPPAWAQPWSRATSAAPGRRSASPQACLSCASTTCATRQPASCSSRVLSSRWSSNYSGTHASPPPQTSTLTSARRWNELPPTRWTRSCLVCREVSERRCYSRCYICSPSTSEPLLPDLVTTALTCTFSGAPEGIRTPNLLIRSLRRAVRGRPLLLADFVHHRRSEGIFGLRGSTGVRGRPGLF